MSAASPLSPLTPSVVESLTNAVTANSDRSVVIIGAGLSGLTVAYELVRAERLAHASCDTPSSSCSAAASSLSSTQTKLSPLRITILESRPRIGGRLFSLSDLQEPSVADAPHSVPTSQVAASHRSSLDLGASWHWPHFHSFKALLKSLGLESFRGPDSARMGGASRVRGGNQRIAETLWNTIQEHAPPSTKVEMKLDTTCSTVSASEDGKSATVETIAGESFPASTAVVVAVPPRLAIQSLSFQPQLSTSATNQLRSIPTWMASSCKVVVRFNEPFWLEQGLPDEQGAYPLASDAVFEWHDASSAFDGGKSAPVHALCAFAKPGVSEADVTAQLKRVYGASSSFSPPPFTSFHVADWSVDKFTSASQRDGAGGHPHAQPELRKSLWTTGGSVATKQQEGTAASQRKEELPLLFFASTELAEEDAGYMEGAIKRGQQVAQAIQSSTRFTSH